MDGALLIDPRLPESWQRLDLRLRCLGRRLRVNVCADRVTVHTDGPLGLRAADGVRLIDGRAVLEPAPSGWKVVAPT
ncbi:glycosyl hydrolase family 65 protein [Cumulibacter manganitolerans]|uniref:glycosyl hydrolase family 65 protein n=1 Tax=Cumulibacter manganitolerans TaxID=1884992 RepID=UPI001E58C87D|nr:glycosyl hydrolase family 65 protein [Cumulibacter manganitolerans]